jgi:plastocyanin
LRGTMRRIAYGAVMGLGLVAGCRQKPASIQTESASKGTIPAVNTLDPATLGDVNGVVKLAGAAPAPVRIDTSMDPACGSGETFTEQYVVHDGKLANVYVYVKSGPVAAMTHGASWVTPVVMDQKGCSYVPHVIAVMVGQRVEFRNADPTMHNVHTIPAGAGNAEVDFSEGPRGTPQMKVFKKPEVMMPVRCNKHPWMNAFINVSATPFFAVTGADGRFELKGLPAGQYMLGLVQEKMGEETVTVTVKPQATATADVTYMMRQGS